MITSDQPGEEKRAKQDLLHDAKREKEISNLETKLSKERASNELRIAEEAARRRERVRVRAATLEKDGGTRERQCEARYEKMIAEHWKGLEKQISGIVKTRKEDTQAFVGMYIK
jgi:hypothetical protein